MLWLCSIYTNLNELFSRIESYPKKITKVLLLSSSSILSPMRIRKAASAATRSHALPLLAVVSILIFYLNNRTYYPFVSTYSLSKFSYTYSNHKQLSKPFYKINYNTNTHLVATAYGGLGNQLYFLCEALVLARVANLTIIPPPIVARGKSPDTSFSKYFRLDVLNQIVPVAEYMPPICNKRLSIIYLVRRQGNAPTQPIQLSSRATVAACKATGGSASYVTCGNIIAQDATRETRLLPLTRDITKYNLFAEEVSTHKNSCVMVDGHSYQRAGLLADEYLYSFLRFVEPVQRIVDKAEQLKPNTLLVVHLRWDEKECMRWPQLNHVCLRINQSVGRPNTVDWVSVQEYVEMIVERMKADNLKRVYLAVSKYATETVVDDIRTQLESRVTLLPQIECEPTDEHEVNMVERELAIRAKVFIADYLSTWSSTIYYKRRTLGKQTEFSKVLVGKDDHLGFFAQTNLLREPQWYEQRGFKHYLDPDLIN